MARLARCTSYKRLPLFISHQKQESLFGTERLVYEFGMQTNAMQEILELRLRTNVELLNSGICIEGLLKDTIFALAATNQSAQIEPLLMAQSTRKEVDPHDHLRLLASAIDILLRQGKHLTIVSISRWLIERLPLGEENIIVVTGPNS